MESFAIVIDQLSSCQPSWMSTVAKKSQMVDSYQPFLLCLGITKVDNMLKLKIDPNLVMCGFVAIFYVDSVSECSYFCEVWQ